MEKEVNIIIKDALKGIKELVDSNTIIGTPIIAGNVTIMPITKVSVGFVAGGGESTPKHKLKKLPFTGASTSGFSLTPVGFISIIGDAVSYFDIDGSTISKNIIGMANKIVDKVLEDGDEK